MLSALRSGAFTSSEIVRLAMAGERKMTDAELAARPKTGTGSKTTLIDDIKIISKTGLSYIDEANMERELGRTLDTESNAMPLLWGRFLEARVNTLLGNGYNVTSQETNSHPTISYWVGSKDAMHHSEPEAIAEIKCPFTPMSFVRMARIMKGVEYQMIGKARVIINGEACIAKFRTKEAHPDGEKYYWQMVSNAIINNTDYAEFIFYCPYQDELDEIRDSTMQYEGPDKGALMRLYYAQDGELPYVVRGGMYHNLNIIRFKVPQIDKELLTFKVIEAGKLLMPV